MVVKEGTVIGFRILIDADGFLMTEYTELPDDKIKTVFSQPENQKLVRTAIRAFKENTGEMHSKIESELDAVNRVLSGSLQM